MADTTPPTAAEIVADIRTRKITAVSAVRAALERAEQAKDLNAFIVLNTDGALAAAGRRCRLGETPAPPPRPPSRRKTKHTHPRPAEGGGPAGAKNPPANKKC